MNYCLRYKITTMKKILIYTCIAALIVQTGCTKKFEAINTDPTQSSPANFDANYFLSNSQNTYKEGISGYNGPILFQSGWVQLFASTTSGAANYYTNMDKYVPSGNTNSYADRSWSTNYRAASLANEIIKNFSADVTKANIVSAATVMKVLSLQYVTDLYGDIPYSQALQGAEGVTQPVYDNQQAVYTAMLTELDGALAKFDAAKPKPSADLFPYAGDVAKWKKFGYSLMLRIAMRLTKADAATAKTWAEKAFAGGTFASVADDAFLKGDNANGYSNPNSRALIVAADYYQVRWSKTLIDYLKATNDPRVSVIAEVPQAGLAANQNNTLAGDNTFANQLGLPNGWDLNGASTDISNSPGYPGGTGSGPDFTPIGKYSRPRTSVYTDFNAPIFVITYAETELLLAEAAARGWSVGANAATHYANGVSAGLQSLTWLSANAVISPAVANAYAAANPLDVSNLAASLKMINEQYWATTGILMNYVEAWNNWKRSGYPVLTAINYAGSFSGGVIPRRQIYPSSEASNNGANYATGVTSLGGSDNWVSKVWWDK
jgi:Starch-binding associating with outer membrane